MYQHINALKKKETLKSSGRTIEGGGITVNVCPHCAAVERLDAHTNNSC